MYNGGIYAEKEKFRIRVTVFEIALYLQAFSDKSSLMLDRILKSLVIVILSCLCHEWSTIAINYFKAAGVQDLKFYKK